jgi:hypothetical protein
MKFRMFLHIFSAFSKKTDLYFFLSSVAWSVACLVVNFWIIASCRAFDNALKRWAKYETTSKARSAHYYLKASLIVTYLFSTQTLLNNIKKDFGLPSFSSTFNCLLFRVDNNTSSRTFSIFSFIQSFSEARLL